MTTMASLGYVMALLAQADGPADVERVKLLKPVMTLAEVKQLWQGKPLHGQGCGLAMDQDGKFRGAFWNVYLLTLPNQPKQSMKFGYFEGPNGYLFGFSGPGFRYKLQDGKYVAVEGPPKP